MSDSPRPLPAVRHIESEECEAAIRMAREGWLKAFGDAPYVFAETLVPGQPFVRPDDDVGPDHVAGA